MFSRILIANRGEIAIRIIRACKEMGIHTIAVFSHADRNALHVGLADESYCIGPAPAGQSYLNMNAILSTAILCKAQAIHPGYGLLSEDAQFVALCEKYNIKFIGPTAAAIARMGDKEEAKRTMQAIGVPVIPGSGIIANLDNAHTWARSAGYPVLLKARSGGGGRGIRLIYNEEELKHNFPLAQGEAAKSFGDGSVYLEKYLNPVKHIEMQLICDDFGAVVCLGERDCSMQRKNQKLLEESPSVLLDEDTRAQMVLACQNAAKAVDYRGVGTIEFLLDENKNFYFMEMNTRLQVEHPVTEMVTGIDLVKWQIRVAAGLPLEFEQKDVAIRGHAIECRINAENPNDNFRPSSGTVSMLHIPGGPWVRFDTALYQGYEIPPFYDSMVGKLIVYAPTREEAIRKMHAALCEMVIEGIEHNQDLQIALITQDEFIDGTYTTDFLSRKDVLKW